MFKNTYFKRAFKKIDKNPSLTDREKVNEKRMILNIAQDLALASDSQDLLNFWSKERAKCDRAEKKINDREFKQRKALKQ